MSLWLRWAVDECRSDRPKAFRLAARKVLSDVRVDALSAFEIPVVGQSPPPPPAPIAGTVRGVAPETTFDDVGDVGGTSMHLVCQRRGTDYLIRIEDGGRFLVQGDGGAVFALESMANAALTEEVVLGPCLCLALALGQVFCFHAGVVELNGAACAFLGRSGMGKSTLADWLGSSLAHGFRRMVDDIAPLSLEDDVATVLPHFPQLKLATEDQWGIDRPQRVALERLYVLETNEASPPTGEAVVNIEPLARRDGVVALVRHGVAARLFAPDLLARHLTFCARLAERVSVRSLRFARSKQLLPAVADAIRRDLGSRPAEAPRHS